MKTIKINMLSLTLGLTFINYLIFFGFPSNEVVSGYQMLLIIITILFTKKRKFDFKAIITLIIVIVSVLVPYLNSSEFLSGLSYLIYYVSLFYMMILLARKNSNLLLMEIINIICYPIHHLYDLKTGLVIRFNEIKEYNPKEFKQIFYGLIAAIPVVVIITIILTTIDEEFMQVIDVSFLPNLIICLIPAVIYTTLLEYYQQNNQRKQLKLTQEIISFRTKYLKYDSFAKVFLIAILPVQIMFIIYEFQKIFAFKLLIGDYVSTNYSLIIVVTIINTLFILIFYYFYQQNDRIAKLIRNLLIIANYLLLMITTLQIVIYMQNVNALTEKRYFALISIIIMFIINLVLQFKTNNKHKNIEKHVFGIILIIFLLFFTIDADSVVYYYNINHEQKLDHHYLNELNPIWK